LEWKQTGTRKPLLVQGVRQAGKTYLIEQFCHEQYSAPVVVNLLDNRDVIKLYQENINAEEKFRTLQILLEANLAQPGTILFVDEVQESEEFISALKFFNEQHPSVPIICAGSLLGVKLKRFKRSFPVGKVFLETMRPMGFEEFLLATNKQLWIDEIRTCFAANKKMPAPLHDQLLSLYRTFLCVGGMPEAVSDCVSKDLNLASFDHHIISAITQAHQNDMNKYVTSLNEAVKISKVFNSIPAQMYNIARKFQYSRIVKGARRQAYETAIDWLLAAHMVLESVRVTIPEKPLNGFANSDYFRLFIGDMGIALKMLNISFADVLSGNMGQYMGAIAENYVATELDKLGMPLRHWTSGNTAEVDFLLETNDGVIPVEVKAGDNVRAKSLRYYIEKYHPPYAIRVSSKNFGMESGIKSIPLYAVFCLGS
jgi:predicted AAA+ superfamily ATPase